jgi:hypothetical protein
VQEHQEHQQPLLAPEDIKEGSTMDVCMYDVECMMILVSSLGVKSDRLLEGCLSFLGIPDPEGVKVGTYLVPFIAGHQWLVVVSEVRYIGGCVSLSPSSALLHCGKAARADAAVLSRRHIVDVEPHIPNAFYVVEHTPPGVYHLFRSGDRIEPCSTASPSILDSPRSKRTLDFFRPSSSSTMREKVGSRPSTRESGTSTISGGGGGGMGMMEVGTKRLRPFGTKLVDVWRIGEGYYEMYGPEELVPFKPLLSSVDDSESVF